MKTKDKKPFLNMDERNKQVAYRIISIMYFLTILVCAWEMTERKRIPINRGSTMFFFISEI